MFRCKAHEIMRNEAYYEYAAMTKDECNTADGRFPTASQDNREQLVEWRTKMAKTIKEINDRIKKGKAVVVTAEEVIELAKKKGVKKTRRRWVQG